MKKVLFLLLSFALIFSQMPRSIAQANSQSGVNAMQLIKYTKGESITLIFLFPLNSLLMENLELTSSQQEGFKFYLKNHIALILSSYEEKAQGVQGASTTKVQHYEDVDAVGFQVIFEDLPAYKEYFEIADGVDVDMEESGFFVKKYSYNVDFPVSQQTADTIISLCKTCVTSWASMFDVNSQTLGSMLQAYEDMAYIYQLISTTSGLRSENYTKVSGLFCNTFIKTYDELDGQISLYFQYVNKGMWYLFALVVVLLGVALAFFISKFQKRRLCFA